MTLRSVPMMRDPSHWSAFGGNWAVAALTVLTLFAFYTARGSERLFRRTLRDEGAKSQI